MTRVKFGEPSWMARLLEFERDGDVFVAPQPTRGPGDRLFGGLIAAQALAAAGATVEPAKIPQSLHLYFVRAGGYDVPVEMHVVRTRDGRSFDTRQVTAVQRGKTILEMIASFHRPEEGADWHPTPPPSLEFDDAVRKEHAPGFSSWFERRSMPGDDSPFGMPPFWIRATDAIEDDPLIRACTLTFVSDFGPVPVARPPGTPMNADAGFAASLDHAVWFHRPFIPENWHRYEVRSVNNSNSRGLVIGSMYDRSGGLVASTTQEALWRA